MTAITLELPDQFAAGIEPLREELPVLLSIIITSTALIDCSKRL